ncbi:MAG: hypothetical protein ACE5DX_05125 [Candidatus Dojkabacteria bacterium]
MLEVMRSFGPGFLFQPLLFILAAGLVLYFIFAKNPVALTGRRMFRMYLYLFLFMSVMVGVSGLTSVFQGSFSLLFGVEDEYYPRPIPMMQTAPGRGPIDELGDFAEGSAVFDTDNSLPAIDSETVLPPDDIIAPEPDFEISDTVNQRKIVYGITIFLLAVIIGVLHFVPLQIVEGKNRRRMLRTMFSAAGVLMFGFVIFTTLLALAGDFAQMVTSEVNQYSLINNISLLLAVVPGWLLFGAFSWERVSKVFPKK